MGSIGTVGDLLDLAVQAERNAEALYDGIAGMFSTYPEVTRFWAHYANEEAGHARWMANLRKAITPEQLNQPADPTIWAHAVKLVEGVSLEAQLSGIHDLQDAWELANEMEHGETNIVFDFLISNFSDDPHTMSFLRTQLRDHMEHLLIGLPVQFGNVTLRRATKPRA